ncbi:GTP pyrophosphokinase [Companilactobacillus sp.]|jgi:putative GTP pyrophosphokinase|uniref:GTP pyrophosphokinase n=1 Tax=Companilactobacillus sp. TaxID=2767905 RepID=UPI0025C6F36D|nr:GTP pyrophosphokinase family protein [Companilactobacillus sp.]MCH4009143.1 GTP pyrophosphokinase family protein [Companilactobacillus sp.]MCH4050678.1 GTP pyrophosphokinase family protein [Companilactobacillus sp.]MCH4077085.1 GTP pyrophosphokinase family protein [Companilactobacillus sp.]MCH4125661.1 GTP pyrophosphokinase family protein [Companilactobacillus sp.]MCI1311370.1 GTP pyrophosphokinase family protein [Companilactobacillus sp.]
MILEKNNFPNFEEAKQELNEIMDSESADNIIEIANYFQLCQAATNAVGARLENLDTDYQINSSHNPIHHMEERMKSMESLSGKMKRKNLEFTYDNLVNNIYDIGGLRVITNYPEDVYTVANALTSHPGIKILKKRDYIAKPKKNGYRSLHIVLEVPVYLQDGIRHTAPVEVQIRTIGMDLWASLEHKLKYKTNIPAEELEQYSQQLKENSDELNQVEMSMESIFTKINQKSSLIHN